MCCFRSCVSIFTARANVQSSWMTGAELNHLSLERLHKLPPFTVATRELNEIRSFIERKKKEHCGAIMRADCEVRVGTVSEGMSRLARLVLLQRRGCAFERIHLRIEISCRRVIPLSVHGEAGKPLGLCFCPKGVSPQDTKEPYQTVRAWHLRETEVLDR